MLPSMMRIRTMAVQHVVPSKRNKPSVILTPRVSFPTMTTRDMHVVLERIGGGGRFYYSYHRRLHHCNNQTHSLTTTTTTSTRRLQQQQQQQQRSLRSQASFPKTTSTTTPQQQQSSLPSSSSSSTSNKHTRDSTADLLSLYSILLQRAALAAGIVYCVSEYVADITLCEGPSMAPTLQPYGEIVLIDKWSIRRVGVQDGCIGSERAEAARQRQVHFEEEYNNSKLKERKRYAIEKMKKGSDGKEDQDVNEQDNATNTDDCFWHEARISVTQHYQMSQNISQWQFYKNVVCKHFTSPLSIGDVVVVQHPARRGTICKRVLGLPGDTVVFPRRYAASWIHQQQQQQSSVSSSSSWRSANNNNTTLAVIPNGHVWLEGDNPANSSDSRYYGPIPMALIQGRVLFRVWPLRGKAWMHRGAPPIHPTDSNNVGFTILPAGYEGQRIVKKP